MINEVDESEFEGYSLFLSLAGAGVPETFGEGVVVDFQLGDLQLEKARGRVSMMGVPNGIRDMAAGCSYGEKCMS